MRGSSSGLWKYLALAAPVLVRVAQVHVAAGGRHGEESADISPPVRSMPVGAVLALQVATVAPAAKHTQVEIALLLPEGSGSIGQQGGQDSIGQQAKARKSQAKRPLHN